MPTAEMSGICCPTAVYLLLLLQIVFVGSRGKFVTTNGALNRVELRAARGQNPAEWMLDARVERGPRETLSKRTPAHRALIRQIKGATVRIAGLLVS